MIETVNGTVEVVNPAEILRSQDGIFEVTSPYGHVFQVTCRRGAKMSVREISEPQRFLKRRKHDLAHQANGPGGSLKSQAIAGLPFPRKSRPSASTSEFVHFQMSASGFQQK